jgi:hypothetical protein
MPYPPGNGTTMTSGTLPIHGTDGAPLGVTGNPDYGSDPFTDFAAVTPATPLEGLNLNWRERDLPERERTKHVHRLHPYLGKFVPQLAEIFLRKYRPQVVCDPFCGSGTTLVEANALGIDAVGCDLSPFNCLLTGVKTRQYDLPRLEGDLTGILAEVEQRAPRADACDAAEGLQNDYLRTWYAPEAQRQLLRYRALIPRYAHGEALQIVLSRTARSARLTTHFDLDFPKAPATEPYYCHKHRRICRPVQDALRFLRRYSADTLQRIAAFAPIRTAAEVTILPGDARQVPFPPCDMVLTSPPYVGLVDYHEQHRYGYELLGLADQRHLEIGAAANGTSQRAIERYVNDMADVFANVARSLDRGGRLVVVVHDSRQLYDGLAARLGFAVEARLRRHVNRRTGRRSRDFFEDVLVWRTR